jgi:Protein of unknown function (DUF3667)
MSNEIEQIVLADTAANIAEQPPRRRGIFGWRRRSKLPPEPLTHCENCGTALTGEFCSQCGQHAIDYRRSLFRVLLDALDSFLNWDTKFLHSLNVLLLRPWRLTNDFNAGRRARYVHPLRLYLIASIIFFLLARAIDWDTPDSVDLTPQDRTELVASLAKLTGPDSPLSPEQREKIEAARTKLAAAEGALTDSERGELKKAFREFVRSSVRKNITPEERVKTSRMINRIPEPADIPDPPTPSIDSPPGAQPPPAPSVSLPPKPKKQDKFHLTVGPDNRDKTPFEAWLERQIKEKIGEDGARAKLFMDTVRSNIPVMMLCCIPLFAFILKMLYIRQGRYYVEHLVYALHVHSFLYVAAIITSLLSMGAKQTVPILSGWIIGLMTCAIVVQIFLSIRRVYRQGWFFSTVKFLFGGLIYFIILVLAVAATTFVTLLLPS